MNETDIPIDIHTLKLQDWLVSRRIVPKNIQPYIKDIRGKITNALRDMPSNEQLIKLLEGTNINYTHCKKIIEILKQTEKDTKSVFGNYGSQRMKDWKEIVRLYEKDSIYLAELSQIYVRNINFEIPGLRKQIAKLDQQSDDCLKRVDLCRPEVQLQLEHTVLLQQLGIKGENLQEEFTQALNNLPELYKNSIQDISKLLPAIDLYGECRLPILRHLIEFGNTTVYQYVHKEAPLSVEEPPIILNLNGNDIATNKAVADNEIDFSIDNGATSSTISAEIIDFGDFNVDSKNPNENLDGSEIDWDIETVKSDAVKVNFDIPIEEYGIVVESAGIEGGVARGEQAYTVLDSPNYRDRYLDELYELEAFLRLRYFELQQLDSSNLITMFSINDNITTHDVKSIGDMLKVIENVLQSSNNEHTSHLFQLKHSPKYADLLVTKLNQMAKAVEKVRITKENLKSRANELKQERLALNPVLEKLIAQTKELQFYIESDISKRYKNRVVNLMGGIN